MFRNPFIEGLIVVFVAVGVYVLGSERHMPELCQFGKVFAGIGVGFMTGRATAPTEKVE